MAAEEAEETWGGSPVEAVWIMRDAGVGGGRTELRAPLAMEKKASEG